MFVHPQVKLIFVTACLVAPVVAAGGGTRCQGNCAHRLEDESSLLQSHASLKPGAAPAVEFTPVSGDCTNGVTCEACSLRGIHTEATYVAWATQCKAHFCHYTKNVVGSTCEQGTKMFVFDWDMTISVTHMYEDLNTNARDFLANKGREHPYVDSAGEYEVPIQTAEFRQIRIDLNQLDPQDPEYEARLEALSRKQGEMMNSGTYKPTNLLAEIMHRDTEPWSDADVITHIFGGAPRLAALRAAMQAATGAGWQLRVLSFGVESEMNLALAIGGLQDILPPQHVTGRYIDRRTPNENWPGDGSKAVYIHENFEVDLPVLLDDDIKNIDQCVTTGYCKGVHTPDTLDPDTLQSLATMPLNDPTAPWNHH